MMRNLQTTSHVFATCSYVWRTTGYVSWFDLTTGGLFQIKDIPNQTTILKTTTIPTLWFSSFRSPLPIGSFGTNLHALRNERHVTLVET